MKKVNPNLLFKREEIYSKYFLKILKSSHLPLAQRMNRLRTLENRLSKVNIYEK